MFLDDKNLVKIDEKVMIYRNFIDSDTVEKINKIAENYVNEIQPTNKAVTWYNDKLTGKIPELLDVWEKISDFIYPDFVIHPALNLQVMKIGEDMFVHEDSPGMDNEEMLTVNDLWSSCCILSYGIIAYFGDFSGGEVFYPELNLELDPKPGDLVIHGAHSREKHGVKKVSSGIRYAFSNFAMPAKLNPGTFYNYKTKEYYKQLKNEGLDKWVTPLYDNNREYRGVGENDSLTEEQVKKLKKYI